METRNNEYHYATLPSGLRAVACHRPDAVAEHCGIMVRAGSRDESPDCYGLAHFVEHTIFKGTDRRRAWHILNRMERVGGELNAYTTKEETVVYTTFPSGHLDRALDLVADLVSNSRFPAAEIDRERGVVEDEIDSYLDIPAEGIFDDFDELIYSGTPLAHPILGTRESIAGFTTDVCRRYLERFYVPSNMILFYSGSTDPERFFKRADRYFATGCGERHSDESTDRVSPPPAVSPAFDTERNIGSHQAHTVLGARTGGMHDEGRYAMALLTNILGGPGMNSMLNVALRERRGLVYTVDASTALLTDTGLFTIYFGCDPGDVNRCRRLSADIVAGLASGCLTQRRLDEARRQYLGQLALASTNTEQRILNAARSTMLRGRAVPREEQLGALMAVTPEDLRNAAEKITSLSRLTLL